LGQDEEDEVGPSGTTQRRGLGRHKTIYNSKTKIGGDYSNNKGRAIKGVDLRSRTTY
jgi:hypothetical protein